LTNKLKRLFLTGSAGHLGHRVAKLARDWDLIYSWHSKLPDKSLVGTPIHLNLCNKHDVNEALNHYKPDVIIHTACSNRSEESIVPAINNIAGTAIISSTRIVHVSTDMVLDGDNAPYSDDAKANPIHPYGEVKAIAEEVVLRYCPSAVIVRTSLIYGVCPLDHQTQWLVDDVKSGNKVILFTDEIRCPIWVDTLAQTLLELANTECTGYINVAGPQPLNRWDFGRKMLGMLDINSIPNVFPGLQSEIDLVRPRDLTLDVSKAQKCLDTPLLNIDESVDQMKLRLLDKKFVD
tara:strand:- start:240 stop:1115 length:876 start_codon:yes stop_codon:yes gene_type:complete